MVRLEFVNVYCNDHTGRIKLIQFAVIYYCKSDNAALGISYLRQRGVHKEIKDCSLAALNLSGTPLALLDTDKNLHGFVLQASEMVVNRFTLDIFHSHFVTEMEIGLLQSQAESLCLFSFRHHGLCCYYW